MIDTDYDFALTNLICPVERIVGVWEFRNPPHFRNRCHSLPGHLLHLVTSGEYSLGMGGNTYTVKKGDLIYYYESEELEYVGGETEARYLSVGFQARGLQPLPAEARISPAAPALQTLFHELYTAFTLREDASTPYLVHSILLNMLHLLDRLRTDNRSNFEEAEEFWWPLERELRKRKLFRPALQDLCKLSGYSKASVIRSCKRATGTTPVQRIRKIRMEEARGLLSCSYLNVTQVSQHLGYPRMHEFSREFSAYFGSPPSAVLQPES